MNITLIPTSEQEAGIIHACEQFNREQQRLHNEDEAVKPVEARTPFVPTEPSAYVLLRFQDVLNSWASQCSAICSECGAHKEGSHE